MLDLLATLWVKFSAIRSDSWLISEVSPMEKSMPQRTSPESKNTKQRPIYYEESTQTNENTELKI